MTLQVRLGAAIAVLLTINCVWGQDIAVSEPIWISADSPPDELPAPKRKLLFEPQKLGANEEIGYVIGTCIVDADGKFTVTAEGTNAALQRAVQEELDHCGFTVGKRHGEPETCGIGITVILNPRSSSTEAQDAQPRLNAVVPAVLNRRTSNGELPIIPVRLKLDPTGAIVHWSPEINLTSSEEKAVATALHGWQFAPARKNGQPVQSELSVPVVCTAPRSVRVSIAPDIQPKPIHREPPRYPMSMRRYGIAGEVTIDFVVNIHGDVENPYVFGTKNPAFDDAAVEAVRKWKFEPAKKNARPVATHMQVPIVFTLNEGGSDGYVIEEKSDQSKLPEELRFDVPPKFRNVELPVYPYSALHDRLTGKAKVAVLIDRRGKVAQMKILNADRPEFGLALAAAAEGLVFDPALKDGKPVAHLLNYEQSFTRSELPDDVADDLLSMEKKRPEKIVGAAKLDAPLKPLSRRPPRFPLAVAPEIETGDAVVEFLVDEDGRTRLPRIVSATEPAFGYAAVQAIAGWRFEPPKSGGKPAVARVQVPINFNAKNSRPKPAGEPARDPSKAPAE